MAYTTTSDSYTPPPVRHSPTYPILSPWFDPANGISVRVGQVIRRTASALWSIPPTEISCVHLSSFSAYTF